MNEEDLFIILNEQIFAEPENIVQTQGPPKARLNNFNYHDKQELLYRNQSDGGHDSAD